MTDNIQIKTIPLSVALSFGAHVIAELVLRRPTAGDLRGIKINDLIEMDVSTVLAVVPRISLTPLAPTVLNSVDPVDLLQLCAGVAGFFTDSPSPSPTTPPPPGAA